MVVKFLAVKSQTKVNPTLAVNWRAEFKVLLALFWIIGLSSVHAQQPTIAPDAPASPSSVVATTRTGVRGSSGVAPSPGSSAWKSERVVSVLHRISGWKLLTLLERNNLQAPVKPASEFVHTNIVAGYMFADRRFVVVRLPQAEIEAVARNMPFAGNIGATEGEPEPITILNADDIERPVRFVGLDAATGLSLLETMGDKTDGSSKLIPDASLFSRSKPPFPPRPLASPHPLDTQVSLLAPVAMAQEPRPSDKTLRLQMSETQAKLGVNSRTDNASARIFARGERLSPLLVGAVAINGTGKLIGVVEGVTNEGARIIPDDELEAAVRRVLTRRTSVPQPWLGAQGQDLTGVKLKSLIENGWHEADAQRLLANFRGVMLTNVLPYTPAAFADLRPGDIVTRIGEHPVRGVDDFSKLLAEAGSGAKVRLTISRAERREQQMFVQLGESLNPLRETERALRLEQLAEVGDSIAHLLMPLGLEIITAPAKLRARLGAEEGLLVVSLRTGGIAAVSGLREGDIIERVNGRLLTEADADSILASTNRTEVTFDIVRAGQRINLMMIYPPSIKK